VNDYFFKRQVSHFFYLYYDENKLHFDDMMISTLYETNALSLIFYSAGSLKEQSVDRHVASLDSDSLMSRD
jgi:hypothetical protein